MLTNTAPEHFIPKSDFDGNLVESRFSDGDLDGGTNSHINNTEGPVRIGDCQGAGNKTLFHLDDTENTASIVVKGDSADMRRLLMNSGGVLLDMLVGLLTTQLQLLPDGKIILGTFGGNGTSFFLEDSTQRIVLHALTLEPEADGALNLGTSSKSFRRLFLDSTFASTPGNKTINKACGLVAFAAGASSLTVTNNLVNGDSLIFAAVQTDDATAVIKNVAKVAGGFTIKLQAPATDETEVAFWVLN